MSEMAVVYKRLAASIMSIEAYVLIFLDSPRRHSWGDQWEIGRQALMDEE